MRAPSRSLSAAACLIAASRGACCAWWFCWSAVRSQLMTGAGMMRSRSALVSSAETGAVSKKCSIGSLRWRTKSRHLPARSRSVSCLSNRARRAIQCQRHKSGASRNRLFAARRTPRSPQTFRQPLAARTLVQRSVRLAPLQPRRTQNLNVHPVQPAWCSGPQNCQAD